MADTEQLFAAHRPGLVRYLTRAVGHPEAALDLAQDVFVRVTQAPKVPDGASAQKSWLFTIARNLAIDHHRRHSVREFGRDVVTQVDTGRAETTHDAAVVNQALASLDPLARDVFVMRELAGLSYTEIAAACELTPDAVRSRIHRARLQLREHLQRPLADARRRPMCAAFRKD
jgi:RNA polymerase sigma-70 factor (ECF subfamily)